MSAAFTAIDRARIMVVALGGPLSWNGTKEAWRAALARKIGVTPRRVRALLSNNEKPRLTADEYLAIERLWEAAGHSLASLSHMASDADVLANRLHGGGRARPEGEG